MKLGFVFPGQGAQTLGMGKELYDEYECVRNIYDKVKEITKIDIAKVTFEGTQEELNQTKMTQLSILTMSLGILEILRKEEIEAQISTGLSLGEYTALLYSRQITFEEGVQIVKKRGEFMQNNLPTGDWSMAAIIGLPDEEVKKVCEAITEFFVVPANYNCPGQVAISGEKEGVLLAMEKAKQAGAKRAIELRTSGPFHTEKLKEASGLLKKELDDIKILAPKGKIVIKNIDGTPYEMGDDIRQILADHLTHPVQFTKCIKTMLEMGVDTFIEIGPGKVLSGFIKKINKDVKGLHINDLESLKNTIIQVKENC